MKIGIYGGSFNPVHLGHIEAAKFVAKELELDKLFLVPAGIPPHKELDADTPSAQDRLEMARFAVDRIPGGAVLDIELKREGKSYTLDTLRELKKRFPDDHLYFLMGTDMFVTFQDWWEPEEIVKLCTLVAFGRKKKSRKRLENQKKYLEKHLNVKAKLVKLPRFVKISSTQLREWLREDRNRAREYLAPRVYGYILREGLYGTGADLKALELDDLRCVALSMLNFSRVAHVLGTEKTAAALAQRWGADENDARRAALLHDCTKQEKREQQLALCRQYNVELAPEDRADKLLHAITGAAIAKNVFGVSREIEGAIRWHTTGKADMSLLEKIIYLADYIEPNRKFCDLRKLRTLAFEDIDRAMLLGLSMAVDDLEQQGMAVHRDSLCARDYLKGKLT